MIAGSRIVKGRIATGVLLANSDAAGPAADGGRVVRIVRGRRIGDVRALLVGVAVCVAMLGCQTSRSFSDGCPGVYSGVRYYNQQIDSMPWDGKIFFAVDLPLSAIFDTILLPFTAFADPERPPEGWVPGCAWAKK